jgi:hypothetical protein
VSTYLYLVCEDHNPPLVAEDESGQHLSDLPCIRQEIADRDVLAGERHTWSLDESTNVYFRTHSARFLRNHPTCRIGIRDEYGVAHAIIGEVQ